MPAVRAGEVWPPDPEATPHAHDPGETRLLTRYAYRDTYIGFLLTLVLTFVFGVGLVFALCVNLFMRRYKHFRKGVNACLLTFAALLAVALLVGIVVVLEGLAVCIYSVTRGR